MATVPASLALPKLNAYPTTDHKPMAETEWHWLVMVYVTLTLRKFYRARPDVYVAGNMLMFYEPGDKRKHVSPDVFVVHGIPKQLRGNYLIWEEGKAPDVVIEITSKTTRKEDLDVKFQLYQNVLRVTEYFLFDPLGDYLDPQLQGHRLVKGRYTPIRPVKGRLPSKILGLHFEANDKELRLFDPSTGDWLPTETEAADEAEAAREQAEAAQLRAEAEVARLRAELEALRRGPTR